MNRTRREFLEEITQSALAVAAVGTASLAGAAAEQRQEAPGRAPDAGGGPSALRETFAKPPDAAKPMTRWWWFGGAVTPGEITRELTFMRDAGLRGAEIQPVYPVTLDDPAKGIRHVRYFSPEWFDLLRHASREAQRLGLQLDITLGSGWPYGGPFVPAELGARRLRLFTHDAAGGRREPWDYAPLLGDGDRPVALLLAPVREDGSVGTEGIRVIEPRRQRVANGVELPPGRWRLMLFVDSPTNMLIKRPTFGMEGLVIDHHNREAMGLFLRAAGDRVFDAVGHAEGRPPFHSVFCDSLEVYGADWTSRLLPEFERRRGYSLVPYLPALFGDIGPLTAHVRYDYHLTLSDLIIDEFFGPLATWSAKRGVTARVQAHGAMGDVMRGYGIADIPEGETIFLGDRYQVNLKHRRLASSAAHIYQRPVASAETYTWLRTPMFTTTLEMMKAASDSLFLDGINQVVNHGYAYSPPEAGEPGWAFYASTEINHTQTWWRHYPHLARYVQRVSAVLQQGESVNPVLVYLPMADVYAEHGVGGLHLDVEVTAKLDQAFLDGVRRAGYDFDVINDHALQELSRVEGGELRAGTGRYQVLIVSAVRMMPRASAMRIAEFVRAGGHLIVVGQLPRQSPGVTDQEGQTRGMREALEQLWGETGPGSAPAVAPRSSAAVVADIPAAIARLSHVLPPDFRITTGGPDAVEHVGFVHRRVGDADCYFVANVSPTPRDLRAEFGLGHRAPQRWDAQSGRVTDLPYDYLTRPGGSRVTSVELRLSPFESCFVVFGPGAPAAELVATDARGVWELTREGDRAAIRGLAPEAGPYVFTTRRQNTRRVMVAALPPAVVLRGPWTLGLGQRAPVRLDALRPWADLAEGRGFSGWGVYETTVDVPELGDDVEWFLELGKVHETAEATLNAKPLGAAWHGTRRLPCGTALLRGANRLRVEVANLWIHHVLAHPPGDPARHLKGVGADPDVAETAGIRWGTYGEVPPKEVAPSGLLGPVRLVPMRRVVVRL